MGRVTVRHVFGLHDGMTQSAAETGGLGALKCLVIAYGGEQDKDAGADYKNEEGVSLVRDIQVDLRPADRRPDPLSPFPPYLQ